jgi:hypothetical protein
LISINPLRLSVRLERGEVRLPRGQAPAEVGLRPRQHWTVVQRGSQTLVDRGRQREAALGAYQHPFTRSQFLSPPLSNLVSQIAGGWRGLGWPGAKARRGRRGDDRSNPCLRALCAFDAAELGRAPWQVEQPRPGGR